MPIDRLSSTDANAIFQQLLSSQKLSAASKQTLRQAGSGDKDVLDAAKAVMSGSGKSIDDFDLDHNGELSGSERDGFVDALVAILSDPSNARTFLNSLTADSSKDKQAIAAANRGSAQPAGPAASSKPTQGSGNAGGGQGNAGAANAGGGQGNAGAANAGGGQGNAGAANNRGGQANAGAANAGGGQGSAGAAQPGGQSSPAGGAGSTAGGVGGPSEASEFGSEQQVDPSKNFDSVPGGGYSVQECAQDIMKLAENDTEEKGPKPTEEQAQQLAQGIINGVNNYFDKSTDPKATAQALIASAWKESKYNFAAGNGGVFQCAPNRFEDWQKAHPGSSMTHADMSNPKNAAASIDVALWAMAHPAAGMGAPSGVSTPVPANNSPDKALYFWNYNNSPDRAGVGPTELDGYMKRTNYFRSLLT